MGCCGSGMGLPRVFRARRSTPLDAQSVVADLVPAERGGFDMVDAAPVRTDNDARVQPLAAVVVLGDDATGVVNQVQVCVELIAHQVDLVGPIRLQTDDVEL